MTRRPLRVLIAEDNPHDSELVLMELRRAGFDPDWLRVDSEEEYLKHLHADLDIVLSDYSMPTFSGPRALELLKKQDLAVPFIIISGTIGEDVAVETMRLGASDYLLKDRLARLGPAVNLALDQNRMRQERRRIQAALRESEAAQRQAAETQTAILNALPAHIALVDSDGVIVAVNEGWRRFAQANAVHESNYFIGHNYMRVCESAVGYCAEQAHRVADGLRDVLVGTLPEFSMEYPCHSPTEKRWFRLMVSPLREGSKAGAVVMHLNITDRKLAENQRHESELRFRQLAENIQEVFWVTSVDKNQVLYISPAYEAVWGRSSESLYTSPEAWLDAIHPEDRERVLQAAITRQMAGTYDEEYRIVRPDGEMRWIRDRAFPVKNHEGTVYRVVGVAKDISDQKKAENKLREQATLLDKAQDAILVRGLDHRLLYWNRSAERLYGWTAAEALGRCVVELLYPDPAEMLAATEEVMSRGEWMGELRQSSKDGRTVIVEARWTLVRDDQGRPKSILAINTDITERAKLEQQFLRAQRMESIGTMASGIAHDLNNVLTPILMSVEMLTRNESDPRRMEVLATMKASAQRGADMVDKVMSFARGLGGQRLRLEVATLIHEIQSFARDTFPRQIKLSSDVAGHLWAVIGDPTQLHQVLLNLCVNARDAMPNGGSLMLSARNVTLDESFVGVVIDAKPGPHVLIEVQDSGAGMSADVIDHIFEPFFTTKEIGKGTGLGLSTTHAIVKSHGGFILVDSEVGKGTTFSVFLPAQTSLETESGSTDVDLPRGSDQLVLAVDEEPLARQLIQQTLEAFGYRVLVASDGNDAVALYHAHEEDIAVVIADMMMQEVNGLALIEALKHLNRSVRVIAVCGPNSASLKEMATSAGVKHFLAKPWKTKALLTTLRDALGTVP